MKQYSASLALLVDIGDRLGQVEVLVGMAKTAELLNESNDACECKVKYIDSTRRWVQHSCNLRLELTARN